MRLLRDLAGRDETLWGAFLGSGSTLAAEVMARAGFDWLVVDQQHSPAGGPDRLLGVLQAVSPADVPVLVRIPWKSDVAAIMWALDGGAQGVIVPMVDTAAEAAHAAGACRYPPGGYRSYGPWRVAEVVPGYDPAAGDLIATCLVQIETVGGIENLEQILDVDGVHGAYVGPQDLSISHGGPADWHLSNDLLPDLAGRVLDACRRRGKIAVAHTADPAEAVRWAELGFDLVTVTSDVILLRSGARAALATVRSGVRSQRAERG